MKGSLIHALTGFTGFEFPRTVSYIVTIVHAPNTSFKSINLYVHRMYTMGPVLCFSSTVIANLITLRFNTIPKIKTIQWNFKYTHISNNVNYTWYLNYTTIMHVQFRGYLTLTKVSHLPPPPPPKGREDNHPSIFGRNLFSVRPFWIQHNIVNIRIFSMGFV